MCSLSLFSGDLMEEFYGAVCIKKAKIILTDICTLLFCIVEYVSYQFYNWKMTSELLGVVKKVMESCFDLNSAMHFFSLIVMSNGAWYWKCDRTIKNGLFSWIFMPCPAH